MLTLHTPQKPIHYNKRCIINISTGIDRLVITVQIMHSTMNTLMTIVHEASYAGAWLRQRLAQSLTSHVRVALYTM